MKKRYSILAVFAAVIGLIGCEKNMIDYGNLEKFSPKDATLKINYASMYSDNRSVFLRVNGNRVSGLMTNRTPFPGGGYNTGGNNLPNSLIVQPGALTVDVCLPFKIDTGKDSIKLYSTTVNIGEGKNYVLHIADVDANTKSVLTEENFTKADSGFVAYRFINLMPNVSKIDLYYGIDATNHTGDTLLVGGVDYLTMTDQFRVRFGQSKTWKIRPAGAAITSAPIANYTSASTFINQRIYNIFACGINGQTAAATKPYVSFLLVR